MNQNEHGVRVSGQTRKEWPGIACNIFDLRWETEPGWILFSSNAALLCVAVSEMGGRCQVRIRPDQPVEGDYFGTGHLNFVAPSQPFAVYASEMRRVRIACYELDPSSSDCLTSQEMVLIGGMKSRYMFRDERLFQCARLLGEYDAENDHDPYALSLTRALQAALLDLVGRPTEPKTPTKLTGDRLMNVFDYISDHLDESVSVKELSRVANLSSAQLSQSFREATGLSLQRWQMDARIRSAQRLMLDDPAESLAEIASLVGFSDSSHFSRAFLDIEGTTPSAWLRQRI
jgi:AraC-like DNA-binding protein